MISVLAALATIGMKSVASVLTGSVGLFSDALESIVNLIAAVTAYFSLWYSARPADKNHTFGHDKIEFFASGLEGILIILAAFGTAAYAIERIIHPLPLHDLELGTAIALVAAIVNLIVARVLLHVGRKFNSIVLEADGHHLMTDVYTSVGVVAGLGLAAITKISILDPLLGILVSVNIFGTGIRLLRRSFNGLMDHALSAEDQNKLRLAIRTALPAGTDFHALRTRQAGTKTFAEIHLLVCGDKAVRDAHRIAHEVEDRLRESMPAVHLTIHIEPIDEAASWEEAELARLGEPRSPDEARP